MTDGAVLTGLIDFYKIYRAFVRGKVESFRLNDSGISEEEKKAASEKATRYFRLALGYVVRSSLNPTLFITCGLMGCGKSTLAAELAFELGIETYSSDYVRKKNAGIPATSSRFDAFGQGLYSAGATASVYDELFRLAKQELTNGRSVIIDASFISYKDRLRFAALAAELCVAFLILYLDCNKAENLERLQRRFSAGNSISDGRPELFESQSLKFETPQKKEKTVVVLDASKNIHALINDIYANVQKRG
jgi:predicted kinase